MEKKNSVFIATSLDGYIADKNGEIGFLDSIPEINTIDSGYAAFTEGIDALVMGRKTFEVVLSFGIEWPYKNQVFVVSKSLIQVPAILKDKVELISGGPHAVLKEVHSRGYYNLYLDGGQLIQSFLREDLIDEMIITIIPVLLGSGIPLFSDLPKQLDFECVETKHFLGKIVQNHYQRRR